MYYVFICDASIELCEFDPHGLTLTMKTTKFYDREISSPMVSLNFLSQVSIVQIATKTNLSITSMSTQALPIPPPLKLELLCIRYDLI